jgi:hypothetical protein
MTARSARPAASRSPVSRSPGILPPSELAGWGELVSMPRPLSERESLEQARAELPGRISTYWQELENRSPRRVRREWLEWRIRNAENRLVEVRARLRAMGSERD